MGRSDVMNVRDKKKAYIEEGIGFNGKSICYYVRNWKEELMGDIVFHDRWSIWIFRPGINTFFGPEFLRSLADQMDEIQAKDEATWE